MSRPQHLLHRVRERAQLSVDDMAALVAMDPSKIEALERGHPYVEQEILERYALGLGTTTEALLADEEPSAVAMLFRSMRANGTELANFADSGLQDVLGTFVRCVRNIAGLQRKVDPQPHKLAWRERIRTEGLAPRVALHEQARRLAGEFRRYLGMPLDAPIASMRALAEDLGITTLFVEIEDEQVARTFDGAALMDPDPAILVNLASGGDKWWRTRMTIAHELCHLLHDRDALDPANPRKFFLLSPHLPERGQPSPWQLTEHFEDLEARASSFAGELLAPAAAIEQLLAGQDPTRVESIKLVGDHFMIGATTAINRLRDTFRLSQEQRLGMASRMRKAGLAGKLVTLRAGPHPDAVPPGAHLPGPEFTALVLRALSTGAIDAIEARAHLGLRLTDQLPDVAGLPASQRAPMMTATQRARTVAEQHLRRVDAHDELTLGELAEEGDGWRVEVFRRRPAGGSEPIGELEISEEFMVRGSM